MHATEKPSVAIRQFFGEEEVRELDTILCDPEFVTLDAMQILEGMNSQMIAHYARSLTEFREVRCRLDALARKIAASLRPKIEAMLREREPNIRGAFRFVTDLGNFFYIKDVHTLRNSRITEFKCILAEYITIMMHDISVEIGDMTLMQKVGEHFRRVDEDKKRQGTYFTGTLARERIRHAHQVFDQTPADTRKKQKKTMKALLRPAGSGNQATTEELTALFDEIWNQATFDMVSDHYQRCDDRNAIHITRKGLKDARALCEVKLIMNAPAYEKVVRQGDTRNSHLNNEAAWSSFRLYLDKSTGEICFADTAITVGHVLGDPSGYSELKKKVYLMVREHLLERSMERMTLEDMEKERAEWLAMLKEEEDEEGRFANELQALMAEQVQGQDGIKTQRSETVTTVMKVMEQGTMQIPEMPAEDILAWRSLRGAKTSEVCAAIEKILGNPIRLNGGSHRIYHSFRTGRTYPFPFHPTKPVNRFILRDCLEAWNVSATELVAAM